MIATHANLEAAVARQFDRVRDRLPSIGDRDAALEQALFVALGDVGGGRLLDLGCGKGRFLPLWQRAGFQVVALDRSWGMLDEARRGAEEKGFVQGRERGGGSSGVVRFTHPTSAAPEFVHASASRLPFADASFDALCAVEVIEHLPDLEAALPEMHRVLRPGGKLVIVDKNAAALDGRRPYVPAAVIKWIDERRGRWMYPPDFVFRERWFWIPGLLRRLRRGFTDVHAEYLLSPAESQGRGRWLFERLPRLRRLVLIAGTKRPR